MPKRQLRYKPYPDQEESWPKRGRHVILQYDRETIVFYDSCRAVVADKAVETQQVAARGSDPDKPFWLKLSFLYTMARSNWSKTQGQDRTLAHWASHALLLSWLKTAIHVNYLSQVYESEAQWRRAKDAADVLIDWSPDHLPNGQPLARRTLQIGLRHAALNALNADTLLTIMDITGYVQEQASFRRKYESDLLLTPYERIFPVKDTGIKARLGIRS